MNRKQNYFRRKGKRGVLYLQERHCGVALFDCLGTTDERIAEHRRREIHIAVERGEYENWRTSFADAVAKDRAVLMAGKAPSTQANYGSILDSNLLPYFGKARVSQIQTQDLTAYKDHREKKSVKDVTIRQEIWMVRWFLRRCGRSIDPPEDKYRYPHKPTDRFAYEHEVLAIVGHIKKPLYRAMALTAAYTGLRGVDLRGLRWNQVDFKAGFIRRTQQKTGKTLRHPLHPKLNEALDLVPRGIGDALVFPGVVASTFRRTWRAARKKAGLEWVRLHDLRHFYASYMLSRGVPDGRVMELMGLKTAAMLKRYGKHSDQSLRDAVKVFDEDVAKLLPEAQGGDVK